MAQGLDYYPLHITLDIVIKAVWNQTHYNSVNYMKNLFNSPKTNARSVLSFQIRGV